PGPPSFGERKSMPAAASTRCIKANVDESALCRPVSILVIVFRWSPVAVARSRTVQFRAARAIRICALVTVMILCYCHKHRIGERCYGLFGSTMLHDQIRGGHRSGGRRGFIGGSDARVIMGHDEAALLHLWKEKRGEIEPRDLSGNLVVQLGVVTESLNRQWYERNTGQPVKYIQRRVHQPVIRWLPATPDGVVHHGPGT